MIVRTKGRGLGETVPGVPAFFQPDAALRNVVDSINKQNQFLFEQGKIPAPLPTITYEEYAPYFYHPGESSPDVDHPEWVPPNTALVVTNNQGLQPNQTNNAGANVNQTNYSLSVSIQNLGTGSSSSFKVGEGWKITVQGKPNQPVTVTGGKNGQSDTTQMGTTNANGVLVLNGSMGQGEIGNWYELWKVGSDVAGVITFVVSAAPSNTTDQTNNNNQNNNIVVDEGNSSLNDYVESTTNFLTDKTFGLPNWLLGVGGLFVAFKVFSSKRGR